MPNSAEINDFLPLAHREIPLLISPRRLASLKAIMANLDNAVLTGVPEAPYSQASSAPPKE